MQSRLADDSNEFGPLVSASLTIRGGLLKVLSLDKNIAHLECSPLSIQMDRPGIERDLYLLLTGAERKHGAVWSASGLVL
jgi:hypothetical protein